MTENFSIEERNKILIKRYVSDHFNLTPESIERFKNLLDNPDIDETYKQYLGDDLRVRFSIDQYSLEEYDYSWKLFKVFFKTYYSDFKVSYKDYARGRINVNKNELRIFKHLALYYLETYRGRSAFHCDINYQNSFSNDITTELFEEKVNEVIQNRLPAKSKFEIVLSLNFADWFLCSTGEEWTSCLNLESQYSPSYWAGLPGFIVDKNKAMLYITSGEKKEYLGIITDKILTRTFLTLNKENEIKALRWYPSDIFFSNGVIQKLPFEVKYIDSYRDVIKYNLNPLFFKNDWTCFGYQDKTMFRYSSSTDLESIPFDIVEKGGQFYLNKDGQFEDHAIFCWTQGFKKLLKIGKEIEESVNTNCNACGCNLSSENVFDYEDLHYCENCYTDRFTWCENCETDYLRSDMVSSCQGNYCEGCYEELFVPCSTCGTPIPKEEIIEEIPICSHCRRLG